MCLCFEKKEVLNYEDLTINMLSITPDDFPVIGNLRMHPNVYINAGHG
jgi:hypothetical protein